MKKSYIALIVAVAIFANILILSFLLPMIGYWFGLVFFSSDTSHDNAEIEIVDYRLCEGKDGEDIIIVKYLLKNNGKDPTALGYEGNFYAYQEGIGLVECYEELPKECNYDLDDQYKNIKGGVEYYAEIAYVLEFSDKDVEILVEDYGDFSDRKKEKVFQLQ